jgi:rSAM/selenodomain-associated transferase 1
VDGVHIGIFLKEPQPGRVKTRLAKAIGSEAAADLYTAMLGDTVTLAGRSSAASRLYFYDGARPDSFMPDAIAPGDLMIEQRGEDLGARLAAAMAAASGADRLPLLFLGSDSPDLPLSHLDGALAAFASHEIVLGRSRDGGAWCIGLRLAVEGFFDDLPWSSEKTYEALLDRAERLGLSIAELQEWSDVDELPELLELEERLRQNQERAMHCHTWLSQNIHQLKTKNPNL